MKEVWEMWTAKEQNRTFGKWINVTVFEEDANTYLRINLKEGNPLHGQAQESLYLMTGFDTSRLKNKAESIGWAYQTMMDLVSQQGASLISAQLTENGTAEKSSPSKLPHLVTSLSYLSAENLG